MVLDIAGLLTQASLAQNAETYGRSQHGIVDMIFMSGPMGQAVLILLAVASIACWVVILMKFLMLRRVRMESNEFLELFKDRKNIAMLYKDTQKFKESHLADVFRTGYTELNKAVKSIEARNPQDSLAATDVWLGNVERAMDASILAERQQMERHLPLLASTGSVAPFIGLFGTVWGIMNSFRDIGLKGSANLAVVAPGISEALITTAIGLVAAIPAVIFYNYFMNRIQTFEDEMSHFTADFLNMLKRDLARRMKTEGGVTAEPRVAVREG
jgi:biopolymer transport protein TolQ